MVIAETDERFHDIIYQSTGNEKLVQMLNNLREQMYRYRLEYIKDEDKRQILLIEHDHIVAALRDHNIAEAKKAAREHIDNQEITVSRNIKEQEEAAMGAGSGNERKRPVVKAAGFELRMSGFSSWEVSSRACFLCGAATREEGMIVRLAPAGRPACLREEAGTARHGRNPYKAESGGRGRTTSFAPFPCPMVIRAGVVDAAGEYKIPVSLGRKVVPCQLQLHRGSTALALQPLL